MMVDVIVVVLIVMIMTIGNDFADYCNVEGWCLLLMALMVMIEEYVMVDKVSVIVGGGASYDNGGYR